MNFGAHRAYRDDLNGARGPITLIAAADDDLIFSDKYAEAVQGTGARIELRVLANVGHMDLVSATPVVGIVADAIAGR